MQTDSLSHYPIVLSFNKGVSLIYNIIGTCLSFWSLVCMTAGKPYRIFYWRPMSQRLPLNKRFSLGVFALGLSGRCPSSVLPVCKWNFLSLKIIGGETVNRRETSFIAPCLVETLLWGQAMVLLLFTVVNLLHWGVLINEFFAVIKATYKKQFMGTGFTQGLILTHDSCFFSQRWRTVISEEIEKSWVFHKKRFFLPVLIGKTGLFS